MVRRSASDRVRYVGEAVAAVVAEDRWTAYAALDLTSIVDYEELPVGDRSRGRRWSPARRLVEPEWGDNLLITRDWSAGDVDAAFAEAERHGQRDGALGPDHRRLDRAAAAASPATTRTPTS